MNVVICGAGEIGSHAADVLAGAGIRITVIDIDSDRLRAIEDTMDVRTLQDSATDANALRLAGAADADLVVAATDSDEINLLTASIAKGLGADRTLARVHHGSYLRRDGFDYQAHFQVDQLICPEASAATAIARVLRNTGAMAVESFARGSIEVQEFEAGSKGSAIGRRLADVKLPRGIRVAAIQRDGEAFVPEASSVVSPGDGLVLVGNVSVFEEGRRLFQDERPPRRKIVIMGGSPIATWLCRLLQGRNFAIRLFETDRPRAEALAEKLDWLTVINDDPTDRTVFNEEKIAQADAFISTLLDDESNILGAVLAKMRGVTTVVTALQNSKYLDLVYDVGVDHAFSPAVQAVREIEDILDRRKARRLGGLAGGKLDVLRVRATDNAPAVGKSLSELQLSPDWVVAAIQRADKAWVPVADDRIEPGDTLLVVGRQARGEVLEKLFQIDARP